MTTISIPFFPAAPRTGFGRIVKAAKAYRMRLKTDHALKDLDNHLMRDIGLPPHRKDPHVDLLRNARSTW